MTGKYKPVRNHVARSALLGKGGPHVRSKTSQRVRTRLSTNSAIDEWLDELENEKMREWGAKAPRSLGGSWFYPIPACILDENYQVFISKPAYIETGV